MTKQIMTIIIQSLIAAFVLMWLVISYVLIEAVGISDIFTDFSWSGYQSTMIRSDFSLPCWYYIIIIIIAIIFGLCVRNLIVNISCVFWALSGFGWLARNFTLFQPYFFTTWEGRLFLVDIAARVLVLLIAVVGIVVTCRSWYRWYKHKNKCGNRG